MIEINYHAPLDGRKGEPTLFVDDGSHCLGYFQARELSDHPVSVSLLKKALLQAFDTLNPAGLSTQDKDSNALRAAIVAQTRRTVLENAPAPFVNINLFTPDKKGRGETTLFIDNGQSCLGAIYTRELVGQNDHIRYKDLKFALLQAFQSVNPGKESLLQNNDLRAQVVAKTKTLLPNYTHAPLPQVA